MDIGTNSEDNKTFLPRNRRRTITKATPRPIKVATTATVIATTKEFLTVVEATGSEKKASHHLKVNPLHGKPADNELLKENASKDRRGR